MIVNGNTMKAHGNFSTPKAVLSVNGQLPDENGDVQIETGNSDSVTPDGSIKKEMLADYTKLPSKNYLDLNNIEPGNLNASGANMESTSYSRTKNPIFVLGGITLSFQAFHTTATDIRNIRRMAAYDANGNLVDCVENILSYTVPVNASCIRFSFANAYAQETAQPMLFEGTKLTNYEPYGDSGRGFLSLPVSLANAIDYDEVIVKNKPGFRMVNPVCDSFVCAGEDIVLPDASQRDVTDIYNLYDALMTNYPQYITKTLLGTIDGYDYPVYRYDFTPPLPINSRMDDVCKVLYLSGTHGGEAPAIIVGYRFFRELCENWRNNELLKTLRFNCHFTVIPLVNPYGYVNGSRKNQNGVDLNRNFTNGWKATEDTTSINYSGTGPASEQNTQFVESVCNGEHFDFGIDHHIFGAFEVSGEKTKSGYFVTSLERSQDVSFADMFAVWANSKTAKDNESITDLSNSYYQTSMLGSFGGYAFGAFENGFLWESMTQWGNTEAETAKPSQQFNTEMLASIMYTAFTEYHKY